MLGGRERGLSVIMQPKTHHDTTHTMIRLKKYTAARLCHSSATISLPRPIAASTPKGAII